VNDLYRNIMGLRTEHTRIQTTVKILSRRLEDLNTRRNRFTATLEELKKASGKVYKSTGAILLESDKDSLAKELAEKKETMLVRSQVLGKQEEKLRSRLTELKGKIEPRRRG
jgi:prefoldin beta subunit